MAPPQGQCLSSGKVGLANRLPDFQCSKTAEKTSPARNAVRWSFKALNCTRTGDNSSVSLEVVWLDLGWHFYYLP